MEDYEQQNAFAWLDEEEAEKRRRRRLRPLQANHSGSTSEANSAASQRQPGSLTSQSTKSGASKKAFNVRDRNHSAQQARTVVRRDPEGKDVRPPPAADAHIERRESEGHFRSRRDNPARGSFRGRLSRRPRELDRRDPWFKERAYDDRRQIREMKKSLVDEERTMYLQRPANIEEYPCQLYYLWPSEDLPMEDLFDHYHKEILEELKYVTRSHLELKSAESLIQVWCFDERSVQQISLRIENLIREMIAKINNSTDIRFLSYPSRGIEGASIALHPDVRAENVSPYLRYEAEAQEENIDHTSSIFRKERQITMALVVQQCLKNLRLPGKRVKLRLAVGLVNIGRRLKLAPGHNSYGFYDFEEMITHNLTELHLQSLCQKRLTDLQLEAIKAIPLLENLTMSYAAQFGFTDPTAQADATLVMQHNWVASRMDHELEMAERNWFVIPARHEENPLEITVVDFDRADYQLRIEVTDAYENNIVRKNLGNFENGVSFRVHPKALTTGAIPEAQSRFPWGFPNLKWVKDRTTMTFDITGTTYKLIIARSDVFSINNTTSRRNFERSDFDIFMFDPDWDSNMSEFAVLRAGEDVSWKRVLNTFFPKPFGIASEDLRAGFYHFLDVVEGVTHNLRQAMDSKGPEE